MRWGQIRNSITFALIFIPHKLTEQLSLAGWRKGAHPQSKTLKAVADYFGVSVDDLLGRENIEQQNIQDNHGIIGHTYVPVTISDGSERKLSEQEIALLEIFSKLSVMDQAKLLVYAEGLKENSK